jgi:hypothetical protein
VILALDPGAGGCGVALIACATRTLRRAAYVKSPRKKAGDPLSDCQLMAVAVAAWVRVTAPFTVPVTEVLAEWPRVYRAGQAKAGADPNDLLLLSGVDVGVACLLGCASRSVEPREWKGTLGEVVDSATGVTVYLVEERVRKRLSPAELAVVELPSAASLAHNVWDAAGLGLHAIGRGILQTYRVYAP